VRVPPPHEWEHCPHTCQLVTAQSTGQQPVLHSCVWDTPGHAVPPQLVACVTARVRCWLPPPHALVQYPQVPHDDMAQFTGQQWVLQGVGASSSASQRSPPFAGGTTTLRERVCWPPPQLVVHAVKLPQIDMAQFTGHASVEQTDTCSSAGQTAPPQLAPRSIVRKRVFVPPPHVLEHKP
jgi:hypothetical protein